MLSPLLLLSLGARPLTILVGMPKTGTGSIANMFSCFGWRSSHWRCGIGGAERQMCGACMLRFVGQVIGNIEKNVTSEAAKARAATRREL